MDGKIKLLLFTLASFIFLFIVLFLSKRYIKKKKTRDLMILISAIVTIIIHYSIILFDYFMGNPIQIDNTMYLPVYPCNVMMWVALVIGVINKDGKVFSYLSEFMAFAGTICGVIGLGFNTNFLNNPDFSDYSILKGLLSHVTLLYSSLYLFVMGYIKVDTIHNLISVSIGGLIYVICGVYSRIMLKALNQEMVNTMFLDFNPENPIENFFVIALLGFIILVVIGSIYETIFFEEENRWYHKLRKRREKQWEIFS